MTEYGNLSEDQLEEALKTLEKEVEKLQEEREDWKAKAEKLKADFENYKKAEEDRKDRWKKKAEKELAEDLIEVLDNLERAIASADEDSGVVQGVKMVADQLYDKLEKKGLQRINAEGEEFDPEIHRAVDTEKDGEDNRVIEQKRKGYMFGDKVLREAEVVVGRRENQ